MTFGEFMNHHLCDLLYSSYMTQPTSIAPQFVLSAYGIEARAELRGDAFVVLAGSGARLETVPSFAVHMKGYATLRQKLLDSGQLVLDGEHLLFVADTVFSKPSAAASVIMARGANGHTDWKVLGQKQTFSDWLKTHQTALTPQVLAQLETPEFTWIPFFKELALRLLEFESRQPELVQLLKTAGVNIQDDEGVSLAVLDPLSFFSLLLKHKSQVKIIEVCSSLKSQLGLLADVPTDFLGVPTSNAQNAWFFAFGSRRSDSDLPTLWALARQAVAGVLEPMTFEQALQIRMVGLAKLTQGLFWLNPEAFLPLDAVVLAYLEPLGIKNGAKTQSLTDYKQILEIARTIEPDFALLSYQAWLNLQPIGAAMLEGGAFPWAAFVADVGQHQTDFAKGNMILDRKYAALLLQLFKSESWQQLFPIKAPFSNKEQLAAQVDLGKTTFFSARALLFADHNGFDQVPFAAGLTLEMQLQTRPRLESLLVPLPFGLTPLVLVGKQALPLEAARQAIGSQVPFRVRLHLTPADLEDTLFADKLEAALMYLDQIQFLDVSPIPTLEEAIMPQLEPLPNVPLNQIFYGAPGTGKTFKVVSEALRILEPSILTEPREVQKKRFDELLAAGQISFVTFHQSFGYEDFVEGIKPVLQNGQISYELEDGLFMQAVKAASGSVTAPSLSPIKQDGQVWRMYIDGTVPVSQLRERCLERNEIRMGSGGKIPFDLNTAPDDQLESPHGLFRDAMRIGDLVLLATGQDQISALGVVTSEYRFDVSDALFSHDYAHARSVLWLARNLAWKPSVLVGKVFSPKTLQRVLDTTPEQFFSLLEPKTPPVQSSGIRPHVLIIDEINRGNVAKIFGELITLLEPSKRLGAAESLQVKLPLSKRLFGVPQSLYIIATMNTADRSLMQLDAALRRRFEFTAVDPQPELLPILTLEDGTALDLPKFLQAINTRIARLLSRDQQIGHAYFFDFEPSIEGLSNLLQKRILPLLEEYFFEDWGMIRQVLYDDQKPQAQQFIVTFEDKRFERNTEAFLNIEAYVRVYSNAKDL
jgi:5-methylcytosine-specific restriction endonuclease McrBC GTP-binding regulatory subunit McrB